MILIKITPFTRPQASTDYECFISILHEEKRLSFNRKVTIPRTLVVDLSKTKLSYYLSARLKVAVGILLDDMMDAVKDQNWDGVNSDARR